MRGLNQKSGLPRAAITTSLRSRNSSIASGLAQEVADTVPRPDTATRSLALSDIGQNVQRRPMQRLCAGAPTTSGDVCARRDVMEDAFAKPGGIFSASMLLLGGRTDCRLVGSGLKMHQLACAYRRIVQPVLVVKADSDCVVGTTWNDPRLVYIIVGVVSHTHVKASGLGRISDVIDRSHDLV